MKQSLVLLFFLLSVATQTFAQAPLNANQRQRFNGTWIFDAKKSDPSFKNLYEGQALEISAHEPEVKIVKKQTRRNETKFATLVLYSDNRGEKNRPYPFNEALEVESQTTWDNDILVRIFRIKFYNSGKVVGGTTSRQTYAVSEDGATLTIIEESHSKIATDSPYGKLKTDNKGRIKVVYERKK